MIAHNKVSQLGTESIDFNNPHLSVYFFAFFYDCSTGGIICFCSFMKIPLKNGYLSLPVFYKVLSYGKINIYSCIYK